ncbi:MAG: phosphoribosylglycinamide formyltransferase [Synergistaceae bacterium]|jgi:formyltetrahydrofolate-dependent phosphoribosylglycinamide formyltransferase|nr:phosphoribosylglycinamide formyltransferase [Synergistaceae bacterium]
MKNADEKPGMAIMISGTGSNMEAIISAARRGTLAARTVLVVSDNPDAPGLKKAKAKGVKTLAVPYKKGVPREEAESAIIEAIKAERAEWVVLAGFMKLLTPYFVQTFRNRIVNIHPALLPSFPGAHAIRDALAARADVTGVTVHMVDELMDHGTIIAQEEVAILPGDTEETLAARIHAVEHRLYPRTLQQLFHEDF